MEGSERFSLSLQLSISRINMGFDLGTFDTWLEPVGKESGNHCSKSASFGEFRKPTRVRPQLRPTVYFVANTIARLGRSAYKESDFTCSHNPRTQRAFEGAAASLLTV